MSESLEPFEQLINVTTNTLSAGLVGFGDGKLKAGKTGEVAMEGVKEITGANAAEEANDMARSQYEDQVAAARQDRSNAQAANQRNQITASQSAGAARTKSAGATSNRGANVTGDVSDFLGL